MYNFIEIDPEENAMQIEFSEVGMGKLTWQLPEMLAANLADYKPAERDLILRGITENARVFFTALLSTVGSPARASIFNVMVNGLEGIYKPPSEQ